jgi:hypothetical protein
MIQSMTIAANTTKLLSAAVGETASQAQPQIGSQIAGRALGGDCIVSLVASMINIAYHLQVK